MGLLVEGKKVFYFYEGKKIECKPSLGLVFDKTPNIELDTKMGIDYKKFVFSHILYDSEVKVLVDFANANDSTKIRLWNYVPQQDVYAGDKIRLKKGQWGFSFDFGKYAKLINKTNESRLKQGKQPIITIVPFACRWLTPEGGYLEPVKKYHLREAWRVLRLLKSAIKDNPHFLAVMETANEPHNQYMETPTKVLGPLNSIVKEKAAEKLFGGYEYPTMYVTHAFDKGLKKVECDIRGFNLYSFPMTLEWKGLSSAGFRDPMVRSSFRGSAENLGNSLLWLLTRYVFPFAGKIAKKIGKNYSNFLYREMLTRFLGEGSNADSYLGTTYQSVEELKVKDGKITNMPLKMFIEDFSYKTINKEYGKPWRCVEKYMKLLPNKYGKLLDKYEKLLESGSIDNKIASTVAEKLIVDKKELDRPFLLTEFGCFFMEKPWTLEQLLGAVGQAEITLEVASKT